MQRYAAFAGLQFAVRRQPGIEEPRRFERCLDTSALVFRDLGAKIDNLPERQAVAILARIGRASVGQRRSLIGSGLQLIAFIFENLAFFLQYSPSIGERHVM